MQFLTSRFVHLSMFQQKTFTAWYGQDGGNYKHWKMKTDRSKKDYMEFLLSMNEEYDMEEVFENFEGVVNALESLSVSNRCFLNTI